MDSLAQLLQLRVSRWISTLRKREEGNKASSSSWNHPPPLIPPTCDPWEIFFSSEPLDEAPKDRFIGPPRRKR